MLTIARVVSFALLVLSLVGIAQASVASRREATNAERLKRGLGPARPRRLYNGSRTSTYTLLSILNPVPDAHASFDRRCALDAFWSTDRQRVRPFIRFMEAGIDGRPRRPTGVVALFTPGTSPVSGASPIGWLGASTVVTSPSQAFGYQYTRSTTAPLAPVEINVLATVRLCRDRELDCLDAVADALCLQSGYGYRLGGVIPGLQGSTTLAPG